MNLERRKAWRIANADKLKEARKRDWKRIKSNPKILARKRSRGTAWHHRTKLQRRAKLIAHSRKQYKRNPDYWREYSLRKRFGLTTEEYNILLERQNGTCAICRAVEVDRSKFGKSKNLCVDHCHATGRIRGLLCRKCNGALGGMQDSPELLRRAIHYLEGT
jgi:hypothetical protein